MVLPRQSYDVTYHIGSHSFTCYPTQVSGNKSMNDTITANIEVKQ